ncbi:MAG: hypothetical protein HRU20_17120 [Pseudomonadales bacterium]|nr:hypothetical protein [Pseudomonadales bacterium]
MQIMNNIHNRGEYAYTTFFCEENIFLLGQTLIAAGFGVDKLTVLFLSNYQYQIPLRQQRLGQSFVGFDEPLVIWDYHVVLQFDDADKKYILDFDSLLDFPCIKSVYFTATLLPPKPLFDAFAVLCREIPLQQFLQQFDSDRSHMLDECGNALATFPEYPAIRADDTDSAVCLMDYIDMQKNIAGTIVADDL